MTTKDSNHALPGEPGRRKFIVNATRGAAILLASPLVTLAEKRSVRFKVITVGEIIDEFIREVPGAPLATTVDTLKSGNREMEVTGIVTAMFATLEVIQKTIALGANFIIAHEPTFYNHLDETDWLQNDEVYRYKAGLLKQKQIAVWRNHDYIHSHQPDGVKSALVEQLGWTPYYSMSNSIAQLPAASLKELIQQTKKKLGIAAVRYIGDLSQICKKVLLMPGAAGGKRQIEAMMREKPDVLVCGEIQEWETAEYVRDARANGQKLSLVVLGHIASEEAGSEYMAGWLVKKFPGMKVTHVPAKNSLSFL
jgi:putative NIF3 family GTP cyclohydrolase 1 type 2